jgi:diacylglycerol kinase family enzyme
LAAVSEIEVWEAVTTLKLKADPPVAVQADGESLGMVDEATVEWNPNALRVVSG